MTVRRIFAFSFSAALALEVGHFLIPDSMALASALVSVGYLLLVALGYMLARFERPYRIAFMSTWPFVFLWLISGYLTIHFEVGDIPPSWSAEKTRQAEWGYLLASVMFLPIAIAASALGVWLGQLRRRYLGGKSHAA